MNSSEPFVWASYENTSIHILFNMAVENIINLNIYHHSNHLRHFDDDKTVEIVSVAICVRIYNIYIIYII